ncbi:MAG TPA: hypothetical protein VNO30_06655 [Kofleriaceae bacterium]|nr:hypothetical protein [Kofleriaceae bacterium]
MKRGRRRLHLALAASALLGLILPGCYDVPKPQCGFRCGPDESCPEGYTCNRADGRCHRDGAPPSLVCGTVDAQVAPDAPKDGGIDATVF